jgi:hypothetical protein
MWQIDYEKGYLIRKDPYINDMNYPLSMFTEYGTKLTIYCLYTMNFLKYEYEISN